MADEALFPRYLPEDLISNILIRLPIRSLLVCTSISKPWNSFIKSSAFISSHLNHKETDSDLCLLQICSLPANTGTDSFLLRSKDREMSEYDLLQSPFPTHRYQVVASCNGLVYLTYDRFYSSSPSLQWILWNPAIKKTIVISERHNARLLEASGLGFDSKTGDFKLLRVMKDPSRVNDFTNWTSNLMVHLYSLKANSWKRLPDIDFVHSRELSMYKEMAFVNGVLHFVGLRSYKKPESVILGFDLADEVFHEIMLPECISNCYNHHFISTFRDSLAVLWFNDHFIFDMEIWVMKEYGVEGSWTKVSTVRLDSSLDYKDLSISGLVFKDDSHMLFSLSPRHSMKAAGIIFSHDLKSHETKKDEIGGKNAYCYLGNYVESLVLLDQPTEVKTVEGNGASGISSSGNAGNIDDHDHSVNEGAAGLEEEDSDESESSLQPSDEQEV